MVKISLPLTTIPACSATEIPPLPSAGPIRDLKINADTGEITVWVERWTPYNRLRRAVQKILCRWR